MSARLLLMGWDAADWSVLHPLIDSGEMPVLGRLLEQGVSGELLSTHPPVTVMQWTSTVTGKRAWQHGVCHPLEMAEDGSRAVPTSARGRRSLAVWQMLAREGRRCLVAGWPATHGEHTPNVCLVSDRFAEPTALPGVRPWPPAIAGTYWPEEIRPHLDPLRMSPDNVQADVISQLVPDWKRVDQRRDRRLGQLRLFLASDFSHQAAMVRLMLESEWDLAVVRFPALGAISQVFAPYLAPRAADVDEEEFELYRGVIAGTCRILDRLLRDLIRAAGTHAGVMVVSPHGIRRKGNAPHPGG
ncbi:hypothetical protein EG831_11635, partial [bacterium]|nr:hypothetical protein [bacterium]